MSEQTSVHGVTETSSRHIRPPYQLRQPERGGYVAGGTRLSVTAR